MASRARILKLLQEIRGMAEVTNRRAICGATHELWMPARPNVIKTVATQRRLAIDVQEAACEPVKIQFGRAGQAFSTPAQCRAG